MTLVSSSRLPAISSSTARRNALYRRFVLDRKSRAVATLSGPSAKMATIFKPSRPACSIVARRRAARYRAMNSAGSATGFFLMSSIRLWSVFHRFETVIKTAGQPAAGWAKAATRPTGSLVKLDVLIPWIRIRVRGAARPRHATPHGEEPGECSDGLRVPAPSGTTPFATTATSCRSYCRGVAQVVRPQSQFATGQVLSGCDS
jgi:hypothetical protein